MRTLILALMLASGTVALSGCQAFQGPDGKVDPAKVQAAQVAAGATGSIFGPVGTAVGIGIAGIIGAIAAAQAKKLGIAQGKEVGYNEGSADAGKPLPSAGGKS